MKLLSVVLLLLLTVSAAQAYTIVMRDGRRVEIPNEFTVTNSTLTYEVSSGFQITMQLAAIDVAATERANGQPKGSLLLKASEPQPVAIAPQTPGRAERSITNQDLESYRRVREQNELAYEKRRKELGLPSLEERRREAAEIHERTQQQLLSMRSQQEMAEEYWRSRATPLRNEIAVLEAQVDFLRRTLDEISPADSFGAFSTTIPFGTVGGPFLGFPFQNLLTPNIFAPSLGFKAGFGFNIGHRRFPFGGRRQRFVSPLRAPINPGRGHRGHGGRNL